MAGKSKAHTGLLKRRPSCLLRLCGKNAPPQTAAGNAAAVAPAVDATPAAAAKNVETNDDDVLPPSYFTTWSCHTMARILKHVM